MRFWMCGCANFLAGVPYLQLYEAQPTDTQVCQEWDCGWVTMEREEQR